MEINIPEILSKYGKRFGNLYMSRPELRDAMKEIVDTVVDRCANSAYITEESMFSMQEGTTCEVDRETILDVKNEIIYN